MLTGKCKIKFDEWYKDNYWLPSSRHYINFYSLTEVMQFAVYVDFFEEYSIHIHIEPYLDFQKSLLFNSYILHHTDIDEQNSYTKREYAREKSIEKANEIYNERTIN